MSTTQSAKIARKSQPISMRQSFPPVETPIRSETRTTTQVLLIQGWERLIRMPELVRIVGMSRSDLP